MEIKTILILLTKMVQDIEKFFRYEFKYVITNKLREKIKKDISYFMQIDNHALSKTDNKYFVRSLYFDNYNNSNFYEKIDGVRNIDWEHMKKMKIVKT